MILCPFKAQTIDFAWTDIKSYEVTNDRNPADGAEGGQRQQPTPIFSFEYSRPNKRWAMRMMVLLMIF